VFEIRFAEGVEEDLKKIRAYHRNQIVDAIEEQLAYTPETPTKNRKLLENLIPPWESVPPIWGYVSGNTACFMMSLARNQWSMSGPFEGSPGKQRRRIFYEDSDCSRLAKEGQGMCGLVSGGSNCYHTSWEAGRGDDWSRGKRLGGSRTADVFKFLETHQGEKRAAHNLGGRAKSTFEKAKEVVFLILTF
jgi:hypothetical protein